MSIQVIIVVEPGVQNDALAAITVLMNWPSRLSRSK
jgi:hypothetical protein